jgi:hypothetical protein
VSDQTDRRQVQSRCATAHRTDLESPWDEPSVVERRFLVEDLVDLVRFYPGRLTVQVASELPFPVTLEELGSPVGSKPIVSQARREKMQPRNVG